MLVNLDRFDVTQRNATYRPWNHRSLAGHFDRLSSSGIMIHVEWIAIRRFRDGLLTQTRRMCCAGRWNLEPTAIIDFLVE